MPMPPTATPSIVRLIRPTDDAAVATIIRTVMPEFGCVGAGYSIADPEVDHMSDAYAGARSDYFVVEDAAGQVVAGAGYGPLVGGPDDTCELRKMYALQCARGCGAGDALLRACLAGARRDGYRVMYLESVSAMTAAARLYRRHGFRDRAGALGATGHGNCDRYMELAL